MAISKILTCVVSGRSTTYMGLFLQKKIDEYGDEETLSNLYICKEVKSLLKKNYNIQDIRKLLQVTDLPLPSQDIITKLETEFMTRPKMSNSNDTLTGIAYNKSDEDVEIFINKYIITK